ncbi:MAG: sugar phosphate isomerase/epimerase family protein [Thermoguttaceae bacterium]
MSARGPERAVSERSGLSRREILAYTAAFGSAFVAAQGLTAAPLEPAGAAASRRPGKKYPMKKSINLWALPYPQKMTLKECFQLCKEAGFDGVEVNFAEQGELSAEATPADLKKIGALARKIGLEISGLCSFLFWPYALTHEDPKRRQKGLELAAAMIRAAPLLGTEDVLVVPGAVYIPWMPDEPAVPFEVCDRRAREAVRRLIPEAEKARAYLNIENIFINAYLHTPQEMVEFVDSFRSDRVRVHFDTGNIMQYHFPEHWIPILGKRIKNVHLKEYSKQVHEFNLNAFRPLLDGTTNWPAVLDALEAVGYRGYLTFEYFHPFQHWPEALVWQTSDALDRMLGRKG